MQDRLNELKKTVDRALDGYFTENLPQKELFDAMRYSLLAGGKRIRGVLVLAFASLCGGKTEDALPFACAVEMLHTYSLIHDDLPTMDNDTLRRGRPTCHVQYGETTATLAGDALQAAAFSALLSGKSDPGALAKAALILADAAGERGMCGGQYLDTVGTGESVTGESLSFLHSLKTGALLKASCCMGVALGHGTEEQMECAEEYALNLGMAFQIRDDVLDATSTAEVLGKDIGSDASNGKVTYLSLYGEEKCEKLIEEYTEKAENAVRKGFSGNDFLPWFARLLSSREK